MTRQHPTVIQTTYNGVTYRSRTEARWAVFLSELGADFEYESETYDLDGVWYLPDFFILSWNLFVEIKGALPTPFEREKCKRLCEVANKPVMLMSGAPGPRHGEIFFPPTQWHPSLAGPVYARFARCRRCDGHLIEYWSADEVAWGSILLGRHADWNGKCGEKLGGDRETQAAARARDERFGVHPRPAA